MSAHRTHRYRHTGPTPHSCANASPDVRRAGVTKMGHIQKTTEKAPGSRSRWRGTASADCWLWDSNIGQLQTRPNRRRPQRSSTRVACSGFQSGRVKTIMRIGPAWRLWVWQQNAPISSMKSRACCPGVATPSAILAKCHVPVARLLVLKPFCIGPVMI